MPPRTDTLSYADLLQFGWPDCGWTFAGPDGDWDRLRWDEGNPSPMPSKEEVEAKRAAATAVFAERERQQEVLDAVRALRPDIYILAAIVVADVVDQLRTVLRDVNPVIVERIDWNRFDDVAALLRGADSTGAFR